MEQCVNKTALLPTCFAYINECSQNHIILYSAFCNGFTSWTTHDEIRTVWTHTEMCSLETTVWKGKH